MDCICKFGVRCRFLIVILVVGCLLECWMKLNRLIWFLVVIFVVVSVWCNDNEKNCVIILVGMWCWLKSVSCFILVCLIFDFFGLMLVFIK